MSNERHPDIEVYIKDSDPEAILNWLCQRADRSMPPKRRSDTLEFHVWFGETKVPVLIQDRVVGKAWLSLWLNSATTPWEKDIDCAREISRDLQLQTRCIVNGWHEGDEPDEWWRVTPEGEEKILWCTR